MVMVCSEPVCVLPFIGPPAVITLKQLISGQHMHFAGRYPPSGHLRLLLGLEPVAVAASVGGFGGNN